VNRYKIVDYFPDSLKIRLKQITNLNALLRKSKIQTRLIVAFIMLSVVPLLIVGETAYLKSSEAIKNKIGTYSIQVVNQVGNNISIEMKQIEKYCNESLISDQEDLRSFSSIDNANRLAAQNSLISKLSDRFSTVDGVILAGVLAKDYYTSGFGQISDLKKEDMDRFFKLTGGNEMENNGWELVDLQGYGSSISLMKPLISDTGEKVGVFLAALQKNSFAPVFENINLGEGSDIFLMDSTGKVISCKKDSVEVGKDYPNPELIKNFADISKQGERTFTLQDKNEKLLITYSNIPNTNWYVINTVPYSYLNNESSNIGFSVLILGLIFLFIALILSYLISRSISIPLARMVVLMNEAENGNLTSRTMDASRDEIGMVLRKYNSMISKINTLISSSSLLSQNVLSDVQKITDSADKMHSFSGHVATTIYQIAQGSSEQASDASNSVQHMESLSQKINIVGADLDAVSNIVAKNKQLIENALYTVKSLSDIAQKNKKALNIITEDISYLSNDMGKVKGIVNVIGRITDQTNLLSLNATIEAARAGKAGTGFAVVADEIRRLSEQTREASVSINTIISKARDQTERTERAAINANNVMGEQIVAVNETDNAFRDIFSAMEYVSSNIIKMGSSVKEILVLKEKNLESIHSISAVSQQASAIVEEVASITQDQMSEADVLNSLAKKMSELARELEKAISIFKV
jgi:methyl-accepting chemotaxis protein